MGVILINIKLVEASLKGQVAWRRAIKASLIKVCFTQVSLIETSLDGEMYDTKRFDRRKFDGNQSAMRQV